MVFDVHQDGAGDALIASFSGVEHTPHFGCLVVQRLMCAHADGLRGSESDKVGTSRRCRTVRGPRRGRIVEFGIKLLCLKCSFVEQCQCRWTLGIRFEDGE